MSGANTQQNKSIHAEDAPSKRGTSTGYMVNKNPVTEARASAKAGANSLRRNIEKNAPEFMKDKGTHVPAKAPSWSKLMKANPNLTRDSKGNVMGKPKK